MNLRPILVVSLLLGGVSGLSAQTVVQPEPTLAPEAQVVNDALYRLRDSVVLVEAAGARIARDRKQASNASLQSRARLLADRCRKAMVTSDSTLAAVSKSGLPTTDPKAIRAGLERSITQLRDKLSWCETEFTRLSQPEQAEELRGYGIGRSDQVRESVQVYIAEMSGYLMIGLGVRYKPTVRGAGSVASGSSRAS